MSRIRALLLASAMVPAVAAAQARRVTFADYFNVPSALELTSAKKADRIAWTVYEKGMRNIYTAAAPAFTPVRITSFLKDDGIDIGGVELSDDGSIAVFVRGSAPNRDDWVANPSHDPEGGERAIWAARTTGPISTWKLAVGAGPVLSPDGRTVLYVRDGQIYRARVNATPPLTEMDRGEKPFIKAWGSNSGPVWSPDGSKIAFVSNRVNHSLIGIYDVRARTVAYVSPSVDFDANPQWSEDGRRLLFTRRPGTPFGQQSHAGLGSIGNPQGPAFRGGLVRGRGGQLAVATPQPGGNLCPQGGGQGGGRGGRGGGANAPDPAAEAQRGAAPPGLCSAVFPGGYTLSVMTVDMSDLDEAREVWHNKPNDRVITNLSNIQWTGTHLVFPYNPANDEFERWYAIDLSDPTSEAYSITTTDGLIEDATSAAVSKDGRTLFYSTNAGDIEKRHIWAVPTAGGAAPRRVSTDSGITTYPQPLASGRYVAVLFFDWNVPASVGIVPANGGPTRVIYPKLGPEFPAAEHVRPEIVWTTAPDGMKISNTLFLPKDVRPGEKRPAMVFVHGGPQRQMLPGYHYFQFYHWSYAYNQWLAKQGYVVLSINYRRGIGYGRSFRNAPNAAAQGNSEYQDVLAGAKYLMSRADVDTARIGIWGLSYGGLLTAQALARNSDIFKAGIDLAGVHLYTPTLDTANVAYRSSAVSEIARWKSPVLLVHGDDDRNVDFAQTVGLVNLLRAHGVYHELMVVPDDLHESMLHSVWLDTWPRFDRFLNRFVRDREAPPNPAGGR
ncbi:MAG TPA: prolyl oligopeptidase family serine peptidase [Gemmatimonadaceae bacterium]|nr:prolyl oligopeptidase family serine peptidase [Gemmatimonadaceae bacterium]